MTDIATLTNATISICGNGDLSLYEIMLNQQGYHIMIVMLLAILIILGILTTKHIMNKYNIGLTTGEDIKRSNSDLSGAEQVCIVAAIITLCLSLLMVMELDVLIQWLTNPEYAAIKEMVDFMEMIE